MKTAPFLGLILAATMTSGLAYAQGDTGGPGFVGDRFAELDRNGDGTITRDEVEARIAEDFANADADGDGSLSQDEAMAFHEARREARRERHHARAGDRFGRMAGDDDVIDRTEFAERGMHRFERADLDENGEVTETEMRLVAEMMGGRHGRHHDGNHEGHHGGHHDWTQED